MRLSTPCFEGFKGFVFDVADISMAVGSNYDNREYAFI
ncbi:hypothetical protein S14_205 [Shewanella sp. phage 1/4]|nr:hypothetical protein S14_205 [Shewanella sp. phage 1/4]AHK11314.1 hypothetical protein S14_205 [Shewanella sp. phage 1/4]